MSDGKVWRGAKVGERQEKEEEEDRKRRKCGKETHFGIYSTCGRVPLHAKG